METLQVLFAPSIWCISKLFIKCFYYYLCCDDVDSGLEERAKVMIDVDVFLASIQRILNNNVTCDI